MISMRLFVILCVSVSFKCAPPPDKEPIMANNGNTVLVSTPNKSAPPVPRLSPEIDKTPAPATHQNTVPALPNHRRQPFASIAENHRSNPAVGRTKRMNTRENCKRRKQILSNPISVQTSSNQISRRVLEENEYKLRYILTRSPIDTTMGHPVRVLKGNPNREDSSGNVNPVTVSESATPPFSTAWRTTVKPNNNRLSKRSSAAATAAKREQAMNHASQTANMSSSAPAVGVVYHVGNVGSARPHKNVAVDSKSSQELGSRLNASTQFPVNISAVSHEMEPPPPTTSVIADTTTTAITIIIAAASVHSSDRSDDKGAEITTPQIFMNQHARNASDRVEIAAANIPIESSLGLSRRTANQIIHVGSELQPGETVTPKRFPEILNHIAAGESEGGKDEPPTLGSSAQRVSATPNLKFDRVPSGDAMQLAGLHLDAGRFPFGYLGHLLAYLQPGDFPVALVKAALRGEVSLPHVVLQSIQVEAGFITALSIGVVAALFLPLSMLAVACNALLGPSRPRRVTSPDEAKGAGDTTSSAYCDLQLADAEGSWTDNWRRRICVLFVEICLGLLSCGIIVMLVTNEQLSSAIQRSTEVVDTVFNDLDTYVRNSHMQIQFLVSSSFEQTYEAIEKDLDNIEELVGGPIQRELAAETGVDVAQEALMDVSHASEEIATKVATLLDECQQALEIARTGQIRMKDLRRHIEATIRQCSAKDMPLCGTLDPTRLDITFRVDTLLSDHNLAHIRYLAEENLTLAVREARQEFHAIPALIVRDTETTRNEISRVLGKHRDAIYNAVRILDVAARDVTSAVARGRTTVLSVVDAIAQHEYWRWLTGLGAALSLMVIWALLLISISCGCCGAEQKAGPFMHCGIFLICFLSLGLWTIAIGLFVIGGHGEVFICKPLYDDPQFETLSLFLDNPGLFYKNGGFLSNILNGNDTINIPVRNILRQCGRNAALYQTLRLRRVSDVEAVVAQHSWTDLYGEFNRIKVNVDGLRLLTPDLQRHLLELQRAAAVNLTHYRHLVSGPGAGHHLHAFADQLESVAHQIADLTTVSRMETLAGRANKLIETHVQPLDEHRQRIVYLLTALEVQLQPLQKQLNQSTAHLRTIQYYVNNQGGVISDQKTKEYVNRLVSYVSQFGKHVLYQLDKEIAPCKSVWDIFDAVRTFTCRHVMDPLNGFWFGTVWCLILFLFLVPASLKVATYYTQLSKRKSRLLEALLSTPDALSPSESMQNTWQTPE